MSHKHNKHSNNPFKNTDFDENIENVENSENEEVSENEVSEDVKSEKSDEKFNELQQKYDTLNQQYLRLAADFENYRKRQEHEREGRRIICPSCGEVIYID